MHFDDGDPNLLPVSDTARAAATGHQIHALEAMLAHVFGGQGGDANVSPAGVDTVVHLADRRPSGVRVCAPQSVAPPRAVAAAALARHYLRLGADIAALPRLTMAAGAPAPSGMYARISALVADLEAMAAEIDSAGSAA